MESHETSVLSWRTAAAAFLAGAMLLAHSERVRGCGESDDTGPKTARADVAVVSSSFTGSGCGRGTLTVTVAVEPGWRIHSTTQAADRYGNGPNATSIKLEPSREYRLAGGWSTKFKVSRTRIEWLFPGIDLEQHEGTVVWEAPIELSPSVDPPRVQVDGRIRMQAESSADARMIMKKFTARFERPE